MNHLINIKELPVVNEIILDAQAKIKVATGIDINLLIANYQGPSINKNKEILKIMICDYFKAEWDEIIKKNRAENMVFARFFYAWVCIKNLKQSLKQTGRELGGRDHTTIINMIEKMKIQIKLQSYWAIEFLKFLEQFNHQKLQIINETKN